MTASLGPSSTPAPAAGPAVLEAIRAARFLEAAGHADPVLALVHPGERGDPLPELLYADGWARGVVPLPLARLADAAAVAAAVRGRVRVVVHVLGIDASAAGAESPDDDEARAAAFLAAVDGAREAGCGVAWTVDETPPDEAPLPAAAALVAPGLAARADLVHVPDPSTPAVVAAWCALPPGRTVTIPHPGPPVAAPDAADRLAARFAFGLVPGEHVALVVGPVHATGGLPALLTAWRTLGPVPGRRLVVAGPVRPRPGADELLVELDLAPGVTALPGPLDLDRLQRLARAADTVVLAPGTTPDRAAALLGAAHGLPVVAPDIPAVAGLLDDERVVVPYAAGGGTSLVDALRRVAGAGGPDVAAAARAIAARHAPEVISPRFVDALRGIAGPA